jgi:hypothetical protein
MKTNIILISIVTLLSGCVSPVYTGTISAKSSVQGVRNKPVKHISKHIKRIPQEDVPIVNLMETPGK